MRQLILRLLKVPPPADEHRCNLAQAWDEGRASAILETQASMRDIFGPQPGTIPNPYRTSQEIDNGPEPL